MGRLNLSKTLNHRTWGIWLSSTDRTIHVKLQRNHLVAADSKCAEVGEMVRCIVANEIVAAALEDCQHANNFNRPINSLDKGEPIGYK
jgi:hypothetical protein